MAQRVNFVHVMTEAEVVEWETGLEAWWASLASGLKEDLRRLVRTAQRPEIVNLPKGYTLAEPDLRAAMITVRDGASWITWDGGEMKLDGEG